MATLKSQQELIEIYRQEVEATAEELTDFEEGSINDILAGATGTLANEVMALITDEFRKTFIDSADGPEITGSSDFLQDLAIDHFGDEFSRPGAQIAVGTVDFTRPNISGGDVIIPVGTIVKTPTNANGETQRYQVIAQVIMLTTLISASVEAIVPGTKGNVDEDTVTIIESVLTDSTVVVTNPLAFEGGAAGEDDSKYRETIKRLIQTLRGATKSAIESKALGVSGVEKATGRDFIKTVIEFNPDTSTTIGLPFTLPVSKLFIADANGTANQALIDLVITAIETTIACGAKIDVIGATAVTLNWTLDITLNPSGPNFTDFQNDTTLITNDMKKFIQILDIGTDFDRTLAEIAILLIWGPQVIGGTGDLTIVKTTIPSGNVDAAITDKFIPGVIATT